MDNTIRFRNAINGYNKDDVNRYIKEADIDYTAALETMQNEISAKDEAIRTLEEKLSQTEAQAEAREAELAKVSGEKASLETDLGSTKEALTLTTAINEQSEKDLTALRKTLADTQATLETRTQELDAKTAELNAKTVALNTKTQELDAKNVEMHQALSAEKARVEVEIERCRQEYSQDENSIAYKSQLYDRLSGQIGDILLTANRDADDLLTSARENADGLLTSAREEADRLRAEAAEEVEKSRAELMAELTQKREAMEAELNRQRSQMEAAAAQLRNQITENAHKMLMDITDELRSNSDGCLKELSTCLTEITYEAQTLLQTMTSRYGEVQDRLQYYQSTAQDSIDSKMHDLTTRCMDEIAEINA